jgi:hypothetical protein
MGALFSTITDTIDVGSAAAASTETSTTQNGASPVVEERPAATAQPAVIACSEVANQPRRRGPISHDARPAAARL